MSDLKRPAEEQLQSPDNKVQKVETQINDAVGQFAAGLQGAIKAIESVAKKADIDSIISNLSLEHDKAVQDRDEQKRIQLEYNLRNAFDFKYAQLIANQSQKEISNQLRNDPNLRQAGANLDMQIAFVLDAMRSPGTTVSKELKQVYLDRYKQLQEAQKELLLLSSKIKESGSANLQNFYANKITDVLTSVENQSILKNEDVIKRFGDSVYSETELIEQSLERFNMIQTIFSPNSLSMADPRGQLLYSIVSGDQRRGRREGEAPYDVSKLPLLVDTVQMARDVFQDFSKDKRDLFDYPFEQWTQEMKDAYASYVLKNYDNVVKQTGLDLLSKKPGEMTPDELAEFSKYRDAYVIEKDYKHYLVTRDDPQWTDEDSKQFARQIAEGGNAYYDPKPWEIGLSWGVAVLGLALGVAAFPLGVTTVPGTVAGLSGAAVSIGSMGMPPVGGPEWLHKLFVGLSLTVAGTQILYSGFTALPARIQNAMTPFGSLGTFSGDEFLAGAMFQDTFVDSGFNLKNAFYVDEFVGTNPAFSRSLSTLEEIIPDTPASVYVSAVQTPSTVIFRPADEIVQEVTEAVTKTPLVTGESRPIHATASSSRSLASTKKNLNSVFRTTSDTPLKTMRGAKAQRGYQTTSVPKAVRATTSARGRAAVISQADDLVGTSAFQTPVRNLAGAEQVIPETPVAGMTPMKQIGTGGYRAEINGRIIDITPEELAKWSPLNHDRQSGPVHSLFREADIITLKKAIDAKVVPGFLPQAQASIREAILTNEYVQWLPVPQFFKDSSIGFIVDTTLNLAVRKGTSIEALSEAVAAVNVATSKYLQSLGVSAQGADILADIVPRTMRRIIELSMGEEQALVYLGEDLARTIESYKYIDPNAHKLMWAALKTATDVGVRVSKELFKGFATEYARMISEALFGGARAESARKVIETIVNVVKGNTSVAVGVATGTILTGGGLGIGLGITENEKKKAETLMQNLQGLFDLIGSETPLLGPDGVNAVENVVVKELIAMMTENHKNMFDNSINGFQAVFSNATGLSVKDVLKQYVAGDKTNATAFEALLGTVVRALPEAFQTNSTKQLVQSALENKPLKVPAQQVVTSIAQSLYNKNKSPEYVQNNLISDLTISISKLIDEIAILYGDLPPDSVSNIQTALLSEQFSYIEKESKKISSSTYMLDVPEIVMREVAQQTYKAKASTELSGLQLVYESDTIKAYKDPNTNKIVLGFRGTADPRDVKAWVPTGLGQLSKTDRYEYDRQQLLKLFVRYSPEEYVFYAVGHSLGGALSTQFKRDFSFIKNAVTYNSAVSPQDYLNKNDASIIRRYTENDVLFNLQGGKLVGGEVIGDKKQFDTGNYTLDTILGLWDMVQGHKMDNFFVDERRDAGYSY